jgi:dynein heavy chain
MAALGWIKDWVMNGIGVSEEEFDFMLEREGTNEPGGKLVTGNMSPDGMKYVLDKFQARESPASTTIYFYMADEEVPKIIEEEVEIKEEPKESSEGGEGGEAAAEATAEAAEEAPKTQMVKKTIYVKENHLFASFQLPSDVGSSVYFSKTRDDCPIHDKTVFEEALEVGVLQGHTLDHLFKTLVEIYQPVLIDRPSDEGQLVKTEDVGASQATKGANVQAEFMSTCQRFIQQVSEAFHQVQGKLELHIPNVQIGNIEEAGEDYELTNELENALAGWTTAISNLVESETVKIPRNSGPLAEIEFWRERSAAMCMIYEKMNMPDVQLMLKVLEVIDAPMMPDFKFHFSELNSLYMEAKDNVKFLTTLERHFKNITSGSFAQIVETLPLMMNAIRMVWIISRHYNTDERMVPLMESIANEIADKVTKKIEIHTILRSPPDVALETIQDAKAVLECWHSTYMKTREKIEQSGTDHRWEFDRKRLFEKTNYMATICGDLYDVATVLDQFDKFLGPELKEVTGDSDGIANLTRYVGGLSEAFESSQFDIFDRKHKTRWESIMVTFREGVVEIEVLTHKFIDTSFQKLRSSEGAFDLLENFHHIQSRESINRQMMEKYKDILNRYLVELNTFKDLFDQHADSPPVYKNYPPIAGSMMWARDLYNRAKQPIVKFKRADMLTSEVGQQVKDQYLQFARAVDKFMKNKFAQWQSHAPATATEGLKRSVLGPELVWVDGAEPKMPSPPYEVNFSLGLTVLIRESKYLDRMGYSIPESALNVTLQEHKYHEFVEELKAMLVFYDELTSQLTPVEQELLVSQREDLQRVLLHGFTPLNWNSQRIAHFIETSKEALLRFQGIVSQIHKSAQMITDVIDSIASTQTVMEADFPQDESITGAGDVMTVNDLHDKMERLRNSRVEALVRKYNSIGPMLVQIEQIVAGSNDKRSPRLAGYYAFWERKMYNAITSMVIKSMAVFQGLLNIEAKGNSTKTRLVNKRQPLFQIRALITGKEISVWPSLPEVYKVVSKLLRNIEESAKQFYRWQHATCIETQPKVLVEDEEPKVWSFYDDVNLNPQVIAMRHSFTQSCQRGFMHINKYLESWRQYDTVHQLWNQKKKQALTKLADRILPCTFFDARLASYATMREYVQKTAVMKNIHFVRVDCNAVQVGIVAQAAEWLQDYGRILHTQAEKEVLRLHGRMDQLEEDLATEPVDLDTLKFVLQTIQTFVTINMQMELEMDNCVEQFRTLKLYGIEDESFEAELEEKAAQLHGRWYQLIINSKTIDMRMVNVKEKFREVTKDNVLEFAEKTKKELAEFFASGPGISGIDLNEGLQLMERYQRETAAMKRKAKDLTNAEGLFNLPMTQYPSLAKLNEELEKLQRIYELYNEYKEFEEQMGSMLWSALDTKSMEKGVEKMEQKSRKFPKPLKAMSVFQAVDSKIASFKEGIPLILSLKNDAMKPRHWEALMEMTGIKIDMNPATFTLQNLIAMELARYQEGIDEIVVQASNERKIEEELKSVDEVWKNTKFNLIKYVKAGGGDARGYVLGSAEDIKLELEDNMLNLGAMSASRFVGPFAERVRKWEKSLNLVTEVMDIWFVVQRKWQYLESIFIGAEDIRQQLPEEAKKFDAIDKAFIKTMSETQKIEENRVVVTACSVDGRLEMLQDMSEKLDNCQKSLTDYLDTKRNSFPRFFFLSDDELLSVLGSSDPANIQQHLLKLFEACKELVFGRGAKKVEGMKSSEGETFVYRTLSPVEGAVESWMTSAEEEMKATLHVLHKEGTFHYAKVKRCLWLTQHIGQVGLAGSQIWWTWEVEDVFARVRAGNKRAMKQLEVKLTDQLVDLVVMVRDKITKLVRKKVNTLMIIDLHARDIISQFVRDSILNEKEFAWESQLRYYWDKEKDDCVIRQCTGDFRLGYEYMGLNGRLVITPLTDRCYMTITQALTFKLGTAPAGPAGTGKTETTKDLAKGLAMPCFVTNCGEGLDYKAMGGIFSGLIQAGAWGCFDEFNRINIEVLSVVSAQLRALQNALNYNKDTCDLGLGEISIRRTTDGFALASVFITMNPGYAGRTALPDNLKALFRPVMMIVPDLMMICQIWLFSEGFEEALVLGKKMTVLYALAKGQLSRQFHYDWGLRALKSVLVMAGELKRAALDIPEDVVLMRALRDANMPKFVFEDVPLFLGLINDLFPGLDCPRVAYPVLKKCIEDDMLAHNLNCSDEEVYNWQVDKIIQMYETILVRHTCMIVGPTGGSKSVVLDTLMRAELPAVNVKVVMFRLNPKAQTVNELYGVMDPETRDWQDGVLSKIFRTNNQPLGPNQENEVRWIIYDGDVDALWIESMNSVMDDNKLLTLPNGERIRLQVYCKMIMEVFDLQYASPATISRCGMVWVDPQNLGYRPYYEKWLKERCGGKMSEAETEGLDELYRQYVKQLIEFVLLGVKADGSIGSKLRLAIPVTNINMVMQLCNTFDAYWPDTKGGDFDQADMEGTFIFSLTFSIGAALWPEDQPIFDEFIKSLANIPMPTKSVYESFFDVESHGWENWEDHVPQYEQPSPFVFYQILVPTTDYVLYSDLLAHVMPTGKPMLYVGESGTAKTTTIQDYLAKLDDESFNTLNINFSSRTSSMDVQINIEANVDKRTGRIYGPPAGKKLIIFIDDMNMPKVDTYGTQQPIALLHVLVGRESMYDRRKDLDLHLLKDLRYAAAMGPPGGGRNPVDPRFVALFNVYNLRPPSEEVLTKIYSSIIESYYNTDTFDGSACDAAKKLTSSTLRIYHGVVSSLPPTPTKFHYIFNLRDLGRVYEGLCRATPDVISNSDQVVRAWRNELTRIFCDRLTNEADLAMVNGFITAQIDEEFKDAHDYALADPMVFGDFELCVARLVEEAEDPRLYKDLVDLPTIRKICDEALENFNTDHKPMTLVLFESALEHLTRLYRVIGCPRGNALLVGVGGSGKQSLTRLGGYMAGYGIFQITLSRGYGETEFKEDLKELYKQLGAGPTVFLFTDAHVVSEGFLESVNNMLTTGMVPALYEPDEMDALINGVRKEAIAAGVAATPGNLWNYYVNKARNNLHIVLAMSPSGDTLRIRCRNFPGLVSACVIDWYFPWPEDALTKVADFFLASDPLPEEHRRSIEAHLVVVHQEVMVYAKKFVTELRRYYYISPKNYLDFIGNYRSQLKSSRKKVEASITRLSGGLTKLIEAAEAVGRMEIELSEKKIIVDAKTIDCEAMIKEISEKSAIATEKQDIASVKAKEVAEQSEVIGEEKSKADAALEEALPAVAAAAEALENLSKSDLVELKAFAQPPPLVKAVCIQVIALNPTKQKLDEDWKGCKTMLGNSQLLQLLKGYDKDNISSKQIKRVKLGFKNPDLNVDNMATVSKAGKGLLVWVVAIVKYYEVASSVEPLKLKCRKMEKDLAAAERELKELNDTLEALSSELSKLNSAFEVANTELTGLKTEADMMSRRLAAAAKLIKGLGSERTRWTEDVSQLKIGMDKLVGDCLLTSSFLSYAGAFTFEYRYDMVYGHFLKDVQTRNLPMTEGWRLEKFLTTDATVQKWAADGLPSDENSTQNGILTTCSSRFPLCIDPQEQAVAWIKNMESGSNLTVKAMTDSDFMKHIELAVQFGNPFLFEAIDEELDPMIDPILEKNIIMNGAQKFVKLGDKNVEWDDNFRLYFTTKLANPHYSPEIMGKTMIINYSVTQDGLANQLLNFVVKHERPDLEQSYAQLVKEMGENAQLLVSLEDTLLHELSSSEGNILDNQELIKTLDETKTKATEISAKLEQATFTKGEIVKARDVYVPVAARGSLLFFAMAGLPMLFDPLTGMTFSIYEVSLDSYLKVFNTSLDRAPKAMNLQQRLGSMIKSMTEMVYDYTCTGIFETHKLMFSVQMTTMIMEERGTLDRPMLDFFLKGDTSIDEPKVAKPPNTDFISNAGWKDVCFLQEGGGSEQAKEVFANLCEEVKKNVDAWGDWYGLEAPEAAPYPCGYSDKLNALQKLCLMRCFRPDRVYNGAKLFVIDQIGEKFVQPPVLNYERIYAQSSATTPMIFILSPGADPQADIQRLGDGLGFSGNKFRYVALGQGQGPVATQLLDSGSTRGYWVLLQNCHLMISWLKALEAKLQSMKTPHEDFRLWMTTDPTDKFPLGIIQRSLKVVTEPPDGLKLNMRSSFAKITQEILDECPHSAFCPVVYVLTFMHAVLLERRKYGKIGWNVGYAFNESDFVVSRRLACLYLQKAYEEGDEMIPWGSLKYLIGDAMYGGRVSDNWDRRILVNYCNEYFGDFLFDDCQKFYFSKKEINGDHDYKLPDWGKLEMYTGEVETLPLTNSPSVFGLHPNAEISYFLEATKKMWKDLIDLQPRTGGGGSGGSREDYIGAVAKDIADKVPDVHDLVEVRMLIAQKNGVPTPEQVVLLQELERYNKLTKLMKVNLVDLGRAMIGEIGMSDALDQIGDALFNGFLPQAWLRWSPASDKPIGSWMTHFVNREDQYQKWIDDGEPTVMWLSGLHISESYLTALVQATCRKKNWPLDKSTLYTSSTPFVTEEEVPGKMDFGTYIRGLYLEGAGWDVEKGHLVTQEPKVLVVQMPVLAVIPVEATKLKLAGTLRTPVYVTQQRKNAMGVGQCFEADLATEEHNSHWVLQGVALVLNTDE